MQPNATKCNRNKKIPAHGNTKTRRAKIHPPYGIVQSILLKTHKTGLLTHVMKLYLRPR